jgi:hypothetical protein
MDDYTSENMVANILVDSHHKSQGINLWKKKQCDELGPLCSLDEEK